MQPTRAQDREFLTLFAFGTEDVEDSLNQVVAQLEERFSVEVEEYRFESDRFKDLISEGLTPPAAPSSEEAAASRLLVDPLVRQAALAIAESGGLLVDDLNKQLPGDEADKEASVVHALQQTGLVSVDLVVTCAKTSKQILRVQDEQDLKHAAEIGIRCACGADILAEKVDSALSLTEFGRKLLNGSWWMTVLLMEELVRLGIDRSALLVEQEVDGGEVDCFADVSGALVIFELKDKEFSLGNAYSFGAKFAIYRPAHAVVMTTSHVGNDAKEHFTKALSAQEADRYGGQNATRIEYIEGLGALGRELERLVGGIYQDDAAMMLNSNLPSAAIQSGPTLGAVAEGLERGAEGGPDSDGGEPVGLAAVEAESGEVDAGSNAAARGGEHLTESHD